jgi:hypothetical protein
MLSRLFLRIIELQGSTGHIFLMESIILEKKINYVKNFISCI